MSHQKDFNKTSSSMELSADCEEAVYSIYMFIHPHFIFSFHSYAEAEIDYQQ